jgi:hypothetical protein
MGVDQNGKDNRWRGQEVANFVVHNTGTSRWKGGRPGRGRLRHGRSRKSLELFKNYSPRIYSLKGELQDWGKECIDRLMGEREQVMGQESR